MREPTLVTGRRPVDGPPLDGPAAEVDWDGLRKAAIDVMERAYAPYSNFPVGVAGLVDDGRIVVGCNVENASYGLGLCAECGMVSALHASGGGRLVAVACVDGNGAALMPCGRCRQLLWENGGPDCLLATARGVRADERDPAGRVRGRGPQPLTYRRQERCVSFVPVAVRTVTWRRPTGHVRSAVEGRCRRPADRATATGAYFGSPG